MLSWCQGRSSKAELCTCEIWVGFLQPGQPSSHRTFHKKFVSYTVPAKRFLHVIQGGTRNGSSDDLRKSHEFFSVLAVVYGCLGFLFSTSCFSQVAMRSGPSSPQHNVVVSWRCEVSLYRMRSQGLHEPSSPVSHSSVIVEVRSLNPHT